MAPVLAFDIETVPDVEGIRRLHGLDGGLPDRDVAEMAFTLRRQATGNDFLPLHLHRVVAISCALRDRDSFKVWSLGAGGEPEAELVQRFFDGIDKYTPQIVSWNGGGFDFPVLHYRGMIHGVTAARYWDMGEGEHRDSREFKWNNYISRYHTRHLDLMDLLALYQPRANAPLDDFAQMIGLPGKIGIGGAKVWESYLQGEIKAIRNYCEADTANTYLLYLRFQKLRGALTEAQHDKECALLRGALEKLKAPHWREFLDRWSG